MKFRAFISADIEPNESLVSMLRELASTRADLKIVKPDLLHVTLKFLGDTDEELVDDIFSRMQRASESIHPFSIRLCGMGAFPSLSNIRVVWVGIEDGSLLGGIAEKLDSSLRELGFERDRKGFVPHLTLARARSGRNMGAVQELLKRNVANSFGEYLIDRIRLKKSVLTPQGPVYSIVREQPFVRE